MDELVASEMCSFSLFTLPDSVEKQEFLINKVFLVQKGWLCKPSFQHMNYWNMNEK